MTYNWWTSATSPPTRCSLDAQRWYLGDDDDDNNNITDGLEYLAGSIQGVWKARSGRKRDLNSQSLTANAFRYGFGYPGWIWSHWRAQNSAIKRRRSKSQTDRERPAGAKWSNGQIPSLLASHIQFPGRYPTHLGLQLWALIQPQKSTRGQSRANRPPHDDALVCNLASFGHGMFALKLAPVLNLHPDMDCQAGSGVGCLTRRASSGFETPQKRPKNARSAEYSAGRLGDVALLAARARPSFAQQWSRNNATYCAYIATVARSVSLTSASGTEPANP
ncbi:uncharacterized protein THITE_111506 [Thermothielavioides terrestris NRRL 8126]|uniref:Uncharacterized protein n=1 Tax=Thermothielavioides terrestris (strain ATCC 38088 / NRRL 8126) TaxID=578455 RepID=G2QZ08_THETT|nr:uncharacterized protein THITE_111506 [Thermothielavioides terrestris NRRL 8126]AEO65440.1 hypothetical protein THITE_111506 [Thermothielavioides terrestris NRRL 8126]